MRTIPHFACIYMKSLCKESGHNSLQIWKETKNYRNNCDVLVQCPFLFVSFKVQWLEIGFCMCAWKITACAVPDLKEFKRFEWNVEIKLNWMRKQLWSSSECVINAWLKTHYIVPWKFSGISCMHTFSLFSVHLNM